MTSARCAVAAGLFVLIASRAPAAEVFENVKVRFNWSEQDRNMVEKGASLVLDDATRQLAVESEERPLAVGYDAVTKVIFEVTTRSRGGLLGLLIGGIAGEAISNTVINDYWCYLEYAKPDGTSASYMLEIDKKSSEGVLKSMRRIFGEKLVVAQFLEKPAEVKKKDLKEANVKHRMKISKDQRPLPENNPNKALLVFVNPDLPLMSRDGSARVQFKLHANDRVIGVTMWGTYGFAQLDPGEYLLVSQRHNNASGFRILLEAGKDYYFLQDQLGNYRTSVSRHTKELVMYEFAGSHYSSWSVKK